MILKKKGPDVFMFESEEDFKNFCADNKALTTGMFKDFVIQKYNKRTKRIDKISSNKL